MPDQPVWEARVKGLLKAELKRRNVTYCDLSARLEVMGLSAVSLIQCLATAGKGCILSTSVGALKNSC